MWTKQQATVALREVVVLHSLRIGGATRLSAGGAFPETLQREGRWASDAYKAYVPSHGKDASWVANVMAQEGMGYGIQPGQVQIGGKLTPFQSWRVDVDVTTPVSTQP